MPKAEKGTPKDIAKRIKSKGLQKLKYFCQMCQKQCRDANGFKCHLTSESHLRQMKLFSENAGGIMDEYSREFESMFVDTLRMRHSTKEVNANNVYQEVIQDRQHVHMNATIWESLTDFVKYLGKKGRCRVRETERGWYVSYIEQDASKLARDELLRKRQKSEREAERALTDRIERQRVEAAKMYDRATATGADDLDGNDGAIAATEPTKLGDQISSSLPAIRVSLQKSQSAAKKKSKSKKKVGGTSVFGDDDDDEEEDDDGGDDNGGASSQQPQPPPPVPADRVGNETKKRFRDDDGGRNDRSAGTNDASATASKKKQKTTDRHNRSGGGSDDGADATTWLYPDILVRIVDEKLSGGRYFRRKAVVERVLPRRSSSSSSGGDSKKTKGAAYADLTVLASGPDRDDGGEVLEAVPERSLETVVPKQVGKTVIILRGEHRGKRAVVLDLNKKKYRAKLRLVDSFEDGDGGIVIDRVDYDDFSKI